MWLIGCICVVLLGGKLISVKAYHAHLAPLPDLSNHSGMVLGLSEMINLLAPKTLAILVLKETKIDKIDRLTVMIHHHNIPTCIFNNQDEYFQYIGNNLKKSLETTSLLFCHPEEMLGELIDRRLAHRLSLYIFYWGARKAPTNLDRSLMREPLRVAVITNPRKNIFRIFYNQAKPNNRGELLSANWFDGNDMTFQKVPLLPTPTTVYKNFEGRVFTIPVIHKPPWHFVTYRKVNESSLNETDVDQLELSANGTDNEQLEVFEVTGGRDHNLIQLIAHRMNFSFKYVDQEDRIQGTAVGPPENAIFTGALGMLQRREVDLFLGDVAVTWERMQAVEFSFFTLADSAAFVTHAPRKLSEALALVRPFQVAVWPLVLLTIMMSGPILYMIIAMPYRLEDWARGTMARRRRFKVQRGSAFYHMQYIQEMNYGTLPGGAEIAGTPRHPSLDRCIWYTINVYLRQSATIPYNGHVSRFFSILLWLCATYVLGDVYSAQLTSQLARPAREGPIDTLGKLEVFMERDGYQLLVERQSAFQAALVNSTGILQRLYRITQRQSHNESYLVSSVEEGIRILVDNSKRAVFGGRETLYFNTKRYGAHRFQLSEKLYTRYSAVAVQFGSPFLDSLNEVIMRLFEAGIIEKITIAEYERMFGSQLGQFGDESAKTTKPESFETEGGKSKKSTESNEKLQPMNLRMLQGAFLALACGHSLGVLTLVLENKTKCIQISFGWIKAWLHRIGLIFCKLGKVVWRSWRRLHNDD
ncbi:ionotropic receptor 40a [Aedes aegypti]|uniref:Ionotropic glutamate receptor L-glutamate and glycine-binding domain-containing protein n=1 Tax=Aedes aegypti TaxID=7159 RepID=A0A6S4FQK7_AEDAE|nr:ionotropic receptor 40a precursor [Aedes aegypti]